jgi:hypothetical protein
MLCDCDPSKIERDNLASDHEALSVHQSKIQKNSLHVRGVGSIRGDKKAQLRAAFGRFGDVISVVVRTRVAETTGKDTSWSLVTMSEPEACQRAVESDVTVGGVKMVLARLSRRTLARSTGGMVNALKEAARNVFADDPGNADIQVEQGRSSEVVEACVSSPSMLNRIFINPSWPDQDGERVGCQER